MSRLSNKLRSFSSKPKQDLSLEMTLKENLRKIESIYKKDNL